VSDTDDLAELRNSIPDLSVSEHLGDGGRLGDLVSDLNDLSTVWVGRSSDTKSIIRECSPIGSSGRLGERVVGDTAISSAKYIDNVARERTLTGRSSNLHFQPIRDESGRHRRAFRTWVDSIQSTCCMYQIHW
jgi:hypothetical protein